MTEYNMLIAGFGGQGVLFIGKIMAYAGLLDEKEVSWLPSYGPEMRGGTANCSVCISGKPIGSPLVTTPNVLVAMNGPSLDKFIDQVVPGGVVIVDKTMVPQGTKRTDLSFFEVPATELSYGDGLDKLANMILLGKVLKETGFSTLDTIELALAETVPKSKAHLIEPNMNAIKLGMTY